MVNACGAGHPGRVGVGDGVDVAGRRRGTASMSRDVEVNPPGRSSSMLPPLILCGARFTLSPTFTARADLLPCSAVHLDIRSERRWGSPVTVNAWGCWSPRTCWCRSGVDVAGRGQRNSVMTRVPAECRRSGPAPGAACDILAAPGSPCRPHSRRSCWPAARLRRSPGYRE